MINFPILESLRIRDYGLFPGTSKSGAGLHIGFQSGITLVLGTNGLGKSTLVGVIYRLLAGPFDVPALMNRSDLGTAKTEAKRLSETARHAFADRVVDRAEKATARLTFRVGSHALSVERKLRDLSLVHFSIDGEAQDLREKETYQATILQLVGGIRSFGDWILLLRHITFYFEDRRALSSTAANSEDPVFAC